MPRKNPKIFTVKPFQPFAFPVDMLRYDAAYPQSELDSGKIHEAISNARAFFKSQDTINLIAPELPTTARWESFGWRIL